MAHALSAVETLNDTHGLVTRPTTRIFASSEGRGWRSLFATTQTEAPFEGYFDSVSDHLVVVHMTGPARVTRKLGGRYKTNTVLPGGAFIMPGGADFGVALQDRLETVHIYLRRDLVNEVTEELAAPGSDVSITPRLGVLDPLLEQFAVEVRRMLTDDEPDTALYVDYLARAAAARLVRSHSSASQSAPSVTTQQKLTPWQLSRAIEFIRANLARDPSLTEIASTAGLSPIYFSRQFRQTTGMPPHQFLIRARTEQAKRLLRNTHEPISSIAIDCGFCNQEHLTRTFRKHVGTTPAAFRRATRS